MRRCHDFRGGAKEPQNRELFSILARAVLAPQLSFCSPPPRRRRRRFGSMWLGGFSMVGAKVELFF